MIKKLINLLLIENKSLNTEVCSSNSILPGKAGNSKCVFLLIEEINREINNEMKIYMSIFNKINEIFEIINLLSLLKPTRYNNYNDWIKIGLCLFSIDKEYLFLWDKWSQKSAKYTTGYCDKIWKSFKLKNSNLSIDLLHEQAFSDNPNKYIQMFGNRNELWLD